MRMEPQVTVFMVGLAAPLCRMHLTFPCPGSGTSVRAPLPCPA